MEYWRQVISNEIIIAGVLSWTSAQILKTIVHMVVNREMDWKRLLGDGGMPSAHSATVTAMALTTGLKTGFDSPVFAVAAIIAIIVMHDAKGVRLETGKQARLINEMMELFDALGQKQLSMENKLKEFVGHTPMQVLAGMLLGIAISLLYYYL